jgi:hypothetical protein
MICVTVPRSPWITVLESRRGGGMKTIVLLMILTAPGQVSRRLPVTIEVKRDVEVVQFQKANDSRGTLYLDDFTARPFRLKKGQRFQMLEVGQEGGCRIRFEDREYGLISCPWLDGFRDHQTDVFSNVGKK